MDLRYHFSRITSRSSDRHMPVCGRQVFWKPSRRRTAPIDPRLGRTTWHLADRYCSAYDYLLAEGFVEGGRGSRTYVSSGLNRSTVGKPKRISSLPLSRFGTAAVEAGHKLDFPNRPPPRLRYDFAFDRSDMSIFPFETWRRISMRHALKNRFVKWTTARQLVHLHYAMQSVSICGA
jgi:hypothetical protein